jgi:hypothetical protein
MYDICYQYIISIMDIFGFIRAEAGSKIEFFVRSRTAQLLLTPYLLPSIYVF